MFVPTDLYRDTHPAGMADSSETTRTAVEDGVRVRKTVEAEPDGTGTVTLAVAVERGDPATVRVTDPALEGIPREAVDFSGDDWRLEGATFERTFAAGESAAVAYTPGGVDPERLGAADPVVELDEGPALEGLVDREDSDAVRELVDGGRDSLLLRGADARNSGQADETDTAGTDETAVDAPPDGFEPAGTGSSDATDGAADERSGAPSDGLARALLGELRDGEVDDEIAEGLREELEPGRSQELRIRHLQSQVGDLTVYAEMLEEFVDGRGTLDAAFDGVEREVAALDDGLETVRSDLEGLSESVEADVDDLEAAVGRLEDGQDELATRLDRLGERLDAVDDRLGELDEFRERLSEVFQDVGDPAP